MRVCVCMSAHFADIGYFICNISVFACSRARSCVCKRVFSFTRWILVKWCTWVSGCHLSAFIKVFIITLIIILYIYERERGGGDRQAQIIQYDVKCAQYPNIGSATFKATRDCCEV